MKDQDKLNINANNGQKAGQQADIYQELDWSLTMSG